jgi:hypothetical protein
MEMKLLNTSSLEMAATLYALGFPIKGIYPTGQGIQMEFFFVDDEKTRQAMQNYYDRKLRIEPNEVFWARREILTRMKHEKIPEKLPENRG